MVTMQVVCGDSLAILPTLPAESCDSCVTDPPYELAFMGKKWDASGIANSVPLWREVLRVLKPGAYLLAFGGTRTHHRMTCAIENAGFIIRDELAWMYGTGFPKSLDVSKAIDKAAGAEREVTCAARWANRTPHGCTGIRGNVFAKSHDATAPATPEAQQWAGWGTALKPAHEPIVLAQKPLDGTYAENVLKHGCGALNVDGCRIEGAKPDTVRGAGGQHGRYRPIEAQGTIPDDGKGRFPANVLLDEVAAAMLDEQSGESVSTSKVGHRSGKASGVLGAFVGQEAVVMGHADSGGASRFFYTAKASGKERFYLCKTCNTVFPQSMLDAHKGHDVKTHPTVKPVKLMEYLLRLVTPPGGTVLDPFAGTGTTLVAAQVQGFKAVGVEMDEDYRKIICHRLAQDAPLFRAAGGAA